MKILMFGWEFPPHISGGLGTACYGLSQALLTAKIKLLFVVPKLFGREEGNFLINASAITARSISGTDSSRKRSLGIPVKQKYKMVKQESMTLLEVPSYLKPYEYTSQSPAHSSIALHWNYSLRTDSTLKDLDTPASENIGQDSLNPNVGRPFPFAGMYGPNLMNEVEKYAEVADAIAVKYSFDIIHAHDWMTFPAAVTARRRSGKPLVVHVHSTEVDRAGSDINEMIFNIEMFGLHQADKIIAVSNWMKQILTSRYNVPEQKIAVVHNGIRPRKQAEEFNFPEIGSHFVTFLGRVTHQKGPRYFVEAAQKVAQEFPEAHFIVAGAGDLLPQTIERVAQLGMSAKFHFTGFLSPEQIDQIWSITDAYVMPSVSEPFGIAPLEAIQGGVPVVLSNQSGVSEVMPHAIKVDFWDTKALAAAICSVLRYESLSQVLRQNSRKYIEKLTWDKAAEDVKTVYHEITGKK